VVPDLVASNEIWTIGSGTYNKGEPLPEKIVQCLSVMERNFYWYILLVTDDHSLSVLNYVDIG